MEIDSFLVKGFANYMFNKYELDVKLKSKSVFMKFVAWFLNLCGIIDKKHFMERYSTVIGNNVYLPFEIGGYVDKFPLEKQIATIVHECQHAVQKIKDGTWKFSWRYLTNTSARARYEAHAYVTNMEIHHWYADKMLSPKFLSDLLYNYGCKKRDVELSRAILQYNYPEIAKGIYHSVATISAIGWFENIAQINCRGKGKAYHDKYYGGCDE